MMCFAVVFHRAANNEFIEASQWYEEKKLGLGVEFITEIERNLTFAAEYPLRYPLVYQDIRRITVNQFPYSIYFRIEKERLVVLAVFHNRRKPSIWQARINS